ncbi:NADH dehydrogenase [ubiquinone] 1 beta subcomplex subunit 10-like [Uloborus diversus]|uniref:NADH dehydrogenase [ubiquinone] 1 beta subcomplex subunit 10-like n=1 Tax=Uloborus diversus TaxID=327109 RepID=UPI0024097ACA|nr:NADH dehydrogenase [ubiquinone] 1 beta subcomplex subunit 10-like [Uloborus diversus]XP_054711337.1 NADH dehydrogenase [ubiquinone] 1 beta subcomplex subunit 10-like [Uloborus diversus]
MTEPRVNPFKKFCDKIIETIDGPVTWFRETVVLPNRKHYPYYHRKFNRVPTFDECYEDDAVCIYEANEQFKRDMQVDGFILQILNDRRTECLKYEGHDSEERCKKIFDDYDEAVLNHFIKYGDLGAFAHVKFCYMKQKHRLVYERRKAAGTWKPIIKEHEGSFIW